MKNKKLVKAEKQNTNNETNMLRRAFQIIGSYFNTRVIIFLIAGILIGLSIGISMGPKPHNPEKQILGEKTESYWFLLQRKSSVEYLYRGEPGNASESMLVKKFTVKSGAPGQRPTPLPQLLGREYWIVTDKYDTKEIPETAPYFIELDVPTSDTVPFGPAPYLECPPRLGEAGGGQCNWEIPGPFGLHGVNSDPERLTVNNPGSSGCVRHSDEDIIFLYHLLDPEREEIRYYIQDI